MGTGFLVDSNIVIDFAANRIPKKGSRLLSTCFNKGPTISIISKIELLGSHAVTQEVRDLIDSSFVLGLTDVIVDQTIQIRIEHKIKLPDAIIAATAITFQLTFLSRNVQDFRKING